MCFKPFILASLNLSTHTILIQPMFSDMTNFLIHTDLPVEAISTTNLDITIIRSIGTLSIDKDNKTRSNHFSDSLLVIPCLALYNSVMMTFE